MLTESLDMLIYQLSDKQLYRLVADYKKAHGLKKSATVSMSDVIIWLDEQ